MVRSSLGGGHGPEFAGRLGKLPCVFPIRLSSGFPLFSLLTSGAASPFSFGKVEFGLSKVEFDLSFGEVVGEAH